MWILKQKTLLLKYDVCMSSAVLCTTRTDEKHENNNNNTNIKTVYLFIGIIMYMSLLYVLYKSGLIHKFP